MFRKLVLFVFLFDFVFKSNAECISKECGIRRYVRTVPFFDNVGKFFQNLKTFVSKKTEELAENNKYVKSAFNNFLDEVLKKKKVSDKLENNLRQGSTKYMVPPVVYFPRITSVDRPYMNAEQLITAHGYLSESHSVLTEDGYMLTMHRVMRENHRIKSRVVLLHHGILGSSDDWLLLGRNEALPYKLLEHGFDVWLLNARGNRYSRIHTNKSSDWSDYWDFSWHEIGMYDLPAEIKLIIEITNSSDLNFIGHSMGCTALLVLLSSKPEYNTILSSAILFAPLAYMYHAKGPLNMLANFYRENGEQSLAFLGQSEFMQKEVFPDQIVDNYCKGFRKSCYNTLLLLGNGGSGYMWDPKTMGEVLAHVPAGGSVKTVLHYVQLVKSGYFHKFDYGADENQIKYNSGPAPPTYNLKDITLPIAIFSSPSDWLATRSDIQALLPQLRDVRIHHVIKTVSFGHFDFLWSPYAEDVVYNLIVPLLDEHLPRKKTEPDYGDE